LSGPARPNVRTAGLASMAPGRVCFGVVFERARAAGTGMFVPIFDGASPWPERDARRGTAQKSDTLDVLPDNTGLAAPSPHHPVKMPIGSHYSAQDESRQASLTTCRLYLARTGKSA